MIYVIDIDGTICTQTDGDYTQALPLHDRIEKINFLHSQGNKIFFFTARGMRSYNGCIKTVYEKYYDLTLHQLNNWGVSFDGLILGKPQADFYVDDKGIKDVDFF